MLIKMIFTLFVLCICWMDMFAWQFFPYDPLSLERHERVDALPDIFNEWKRTLHHERDSMLSYFKGSFIVLLLPLLHVSS